MNCTSVSLVTCALAIFVMPTSVLAQVVTKHGCEANKTLQQSDPIGLEHMGKSIAVGDFNNDGRPDIALGGFRHDGLTDGVSRAVVFLGKDPSSTGGPDAQFTDNVFTFSGDADEDQVGYSVAFLSGLSPNGGDALVVGAPQFTQSGVTHAGRVSVIFGQPYNVATQTIHITLLADFEFDGSVTDANFGSCVATGCSGNGTCRDELLVGAPGSEDYLPALSPPGRAYLFGPSTLAAAASLASSSPGVPILVSASTGTAGLTGSPPHLVSAIAHRVLAGHYDGDGFGHAVAFVGNLDLTAGDEFLIGAPQVQTDVVNSVATIKMTGHGYAELFTAAELNPLKRFDGEQWIADPLGSAEGTGGEGFGMSVAGNVQLHDPITNTVPDLLIGAPLFDETSPPRDEDRGRVLAFSGIAAASGVATQLLVDSTTGVTRLLGFAANEQFGFAISGVDDLTSDGFGEVLVGAWNNGAGPGTVTNCSVSSEGGRYAGVAYLFSGNNITQQVPLLAQLYGENGRDHMGYAVAAAHLVHSGSTAEREDLITTGPAWDFIPGSETTSDTGRGYVWLGEEIFH